jgi:Tfp pilus assembly protein PilX
VSPHGDQRGIALVLSLIVLMLLSGPVLAFLAAGALEPRIARNLGDAARARWLAEAGLEIGYGALVAAADADDSWGGLLASAGAAAPWVTLPGLAAAALPGLSIAEGTYTVSIRNDVAGDANDVVIMRSTGAFNTAARTLEVVVRRRRAPGVPAAGVRALHAMSNWRER